MERSEMLGGLAFLASVVAIGAVLATAHSNDRRLAARQADRTEELRKLVEEQVARSTATLRQELVQRLDAICDNLGVASPGQSSAMNVEFRELVRLAKRDPEAAVLLRNGIEAVILNAMADELAAVDWLDALSQEKVQKLLRNAAQSSMNMGMNQYHTPLDVSGIDGVDGKIDRILQEFEGVNFYSHNNALVKQMVAMGDEAIGPLLDRLRNGSNMNDFTKRMAIQEALGKLLTEEHEEIILAEFARSGEFANLIKKYQFPAAEEELMGKIAHPHNGHVGNDVVDAALRMNRDRSIPLLIDHVSYGQNVGYAARQLADMGIDMTTPLKMAAAHANNTWEKGQLVELCLEQGLPEGYVLAAQVLRSNDENTEHAKDQVCKQIMKYAGVGGTYEEVADWLEQNQ